MADNVTTTTAGSGLAAGTVIATRAVVYSGDTAQLAPVALVTLAGADDAKTATDVSTASPLPVRISANDVGSLVVTENGNLAAGQSNLTAVVTFPYLLVGTAWVNGGYTPSKTVSAASTNATSLKATAGVVGGVYASNINAAARYLKFYNKSSAPTVGTDIPVQTYLIPGNTAGGGTNIPIPERGIAFSAGIAWALTTGVQDSDTGAVAANDLVVNILYR